MNTFYPFNSILKRIAAPVPAMRRVSLLLLFSLIAGSSVLAQVRLVADLDPFTTGEEDWDPQWFSSHESDGSRSFFIAGGRQLWTSDGTLEGTHLVTDLGSITELEVINGIAYLSTFSDEAGTELWKSDGTAAGTVLVKDIYAGRGGSSPMYLRNVGGLLYFSANNKINGREIWKSDGTAAGTQLVSDVMPGAGSSNPSHLTVAGNKIYFKANDGTNGHELWATDGTSAGTYLVKDIDPTAGQGSAPELITNLNGTVYFAASSPGQGKQLWKSDGTTSGTSLVKIIRGGGQSAAISKITAVGDKVFFEANDGIHGSELWRSDGTTAGTYMAKDLTPGPGSAVGDFTPHLDHFASVNGKLFFLGVATGYQRLYVSDGTDTGTVALTDFPDIYFSFMEPGISEINGFAYFMGKDNTGIGLYKTDGITTTLVKSEAAETYTFDVMFQNINGQYFYISDQTFWKTDGTTGGTGRLRWIGFPNGSVPQSITDAGHALYFNNWGSPRGVWKTDGTPGGTVKVSDGDPYAMYGYNNLLYALGWGNQDGLWRTDGTAAGTFRLADSAWPGSMKGMNGKLYFSNASSGTGSELWQTDGTVAGTSLVKDVVPGSAGSFPENLVAVGSTLYFTGVATAQGSELYKSDGTAAGTVLVKDINPGEASSSISAGVAFNGKYIFQANDGTNGMEVWVSDGTTAGTTMLKDIRTGDPYSNTSDIGEMISTSSYVFFTALNESGKVSLWRTNGTSSGTVKLRDFESTVVSRMLGKTSTHAIFHLQVPGGSELWKTNGTPNGTQRIRALSDHYPSNWPSAILNNVIYFRVVSPGEAIWRTDGTLEGTYPIPFDGTVDGLTTSGPYVYFGGNSATYGYELFLIDESSHSSASAREGIASETLYSSDALVSGYPNPFHSNITLRVAGTAGDTFTLNVISAKGEKIDLARSLKCNEDHFLGETWRSGMYMLQIVHNNKLITKKIIKLND